MDKLLGKIERTVELLFVGEKTEPRVMGFEPAICGPLRVLARRVTDYANVAPRLYFFLNSTNTQINFYICTNFTTVQRCHDLLLRVIKKVLTALMIEE